MKPKKTICATRPNGNKYHYIVGTAILHNEYGPAVETSEGVKQWCLEDKTVDPETIVDLHLSRGVFCWYNENTDTLNFNDNTNQQEEHA
jgi:hypothetical protein